MTRELPSGRRPPMTQPMTERTTEPMVHPMTYPMTAIDHAASAR